VQISKRIGAGDWFCQHILPPDPDCRARLHTGKSVMGKSGKGGFMQGGSGHAGCSPSCSPPRKGLPDLHDTTGMPEMGPALYSAVMGRERVCRGPASGTGQPRGPNP
jgi:hypothetical protein